MDASLQQVRECKFYSDGATTAIQQRVRLHPAVTVIAAFLSSRRFAVFSLSTKPGAITLEVMPRDPSWRANDLARPTRSASRAGARAVSWATL